ncbi:MAG: hypothetical protein ACKVOP_07465, partial [Sphingomonadaceae bacterium]
VLGLHLRSFVTTTKPQHSLSHNLKSVPLVLTGNTLGWMTPTKYAASAGVNPGGCRPETLAKAGLKTGGPSLMGWRRTQ